MYGCWNGVLFGTTYLSECYIGRTEVFLSVEAEVYYFIEFMLFIENNNKDAAVPTLTKGKVQWKRTDDSEWSSEREIEFVAEKVLNLRIFPDEDDKMDRAVLDVPGGAILSISQFTLASFIKKGRRPDFSNALEPEKAEKLYDHFCEKLSSKIKVERGIFGAMMDISSVNDGPVTFIIEKNFNNI